MLGSDPISALLGAGVDPNAPKSVWKGYLRALATHGCAVVMLGPDVVVPPAADTATLRGIRDLIDRFPPSTHMPPETTGKLAGSPVIDTDPMVVPLRVEAYYKHIATALAPHLKDRAEKTEHAVNLLTNGTVTPSAGIHVQRSGLVAVEVPDAAAMNRWRTWAFEMSDDYHERHAAPTLLMPGLPGGGIFLFRPLQPMPPLELVVSGSIVVSSGNTTVPVPPTRQGGNQITRLGGCRALPGWLQTQLLTGGRPEPMQQPVP